MVEVERLYGSASVSCAKRSQLLILMFSLSSATINMKISSTTTCRRSPSSWARKSKRASACAILNQPKSENRTKYRVATRKSPKALINGLMEEGFDPSYSKKTRYDGGLGHAFARVLKFAEPAGQARTSVPVMVNTYYPPAPSAQRCVALRPRAGERFARYSGDQRVVVVGSGGLSHTKIDEQLDHAIYSGAQAKRSELHGGDACVGSGGRDFRNS